MKSSQIIARARSLADIPNSKYISTDDEKQSLIESYKDIYSKITDSSDDYFIKSVVVSTATATQLGESEYELTIPDDVYKLRFVDYQNNGRWVNMEKFNTNLRNSLPGEPKYRWRGNKLWIITGAFNGLPSNIRIDYYPPPVEPSVPEKTLEYLQAYQPYDLGKITSPFFLEQNNNDYLFYIYNGTDIYVESISLNSVTRLYTGITISNVVYFAGYVYYISAGNIYRATTNLSAVIVPVAITALGTITSFSLSGGLINYITGTDTYNCMLDGTGSTLVNNFSMLDVCTLNGSIVFMKSTGIVNIGGVDTALNVVQVASDGVALYTLAHSGDINKTLDYGLPTETTETIGIGFDIRGGEILYSFIAVTGFAYSVNALSTISDTDFVYPLNQANELLAYQCAIDFKRKENGETVQLEKRYMEVMDRMLDELKRDEYQAERRTPEYNRPYNW